MAFPKGFTWGAAAAAYQIEGASAEGGRGPCVWDMFCRGEGAVQGGQSGRVACDHYRRWPEDVRLMQDMGLHAYRLSVSWPRVMPDGTGPANEQGLAFYDRLIDGLLEAGITPYVTLFHWDYPYELFCRGGWLNPDAPEWFARYTELIAKRLGDRVTHWITLNEPQCFLGLGHRDGTHAPGLRLGWAQVLRATHHALLAHGRAVMALREHCDRKPTIGFAPVGSVCYPATDAPADVEAARRQMFTPRGKTFWNNTLFADPVCLGHYPADAIELWGDDFPKFTDADLRTIHQPIDFYGVNIYQGRPVSAGDDGTPRPLDRPAGHPTNAFHWPIDPPALRWGPRFLYERYRLPVYITENGMSGLDWVGLDGAVHDPQRIDYTRRHLRELAKAVDDGVDVRGYFHWSLLDNFEWAEGYRQRFGLVHVDYATQKRTPKDSARWYAQTVRTNGSDI